MSQYFLGCLNWHYKVMKFLTHPAKVYNFCIFSERTCCLLSLIYLLFKFGITGMRTHLLTRNSSRKKQYSMLRWIMSFLTRRQKLPPPYLCNFLFLCSSSFYLFLLSNQFERLCRAQCKWNLRPGKKGDLANFTSAL